MYHNPKQCTLYLFSLQSVIVKSIERNAANMYMARLHLLGMKKDEKNFPFSCDKKLAESKILTSDEGVTLSTIGKFLHSICNNLIGLVYSFVHKVCGPGKPM
jgi:hypothetical protein